MARTKETPAPTPAAREPLLVCPWDGSVLKSAGGLCPKGGGYPFGMDCPFACPVCRAPLSWTGGCNACHGARTGRREDWVMPGDRYDLYDDEGRPLHDGHHWILVQRGPIRACSPDDNVDALAAVRRIMKKSPLLTKGER